jgi:hypothetical protein
MRSATLSLRIMEAAAEIASRVPEMSRDCALNNAELLSNFLKEAFEPELKREAQEQQELERFGL